MITVPAFPDLLKPGAPVSTGDGCGIVTAMYTTNRTPPEAIARVDLDDDTEAERYPLWSLRLILDDPDRIGQTLALGWLARRLGVPEPVVGCPEWIRIGHPGRDLGTYRLGDRMIFFGCEPWGHASRWAWGALCRPERGDYGPCPPLDNPDADDAPIRALALAVETVGRMP